MFPDYDLSDPNNQLPLQQPDMPIAQPAPPQVQPPAQPPQASREQKMGRISDLLGNYMYAVAQGLQASATLPGGRGTRAGMGAALGAPFELEQMRQKQQVEQSRAEQERANAERLRGILELQQQEAQAKMTPVQVKNLATGKIETVPLYLAKPLIDAGRAVMVVQQQGENAMAVQSEKGKQAENLQNLKTAGAVTVEGEKAKFRTMLQDVINKGRMEADANKIKTERETPYSDKLQGQRVQLRQASGTGAAAPALSDEALDMVARQFATSGALPTNMGRGAQATARSTQIMNLAASKYPDLNPALQAADFKSNMAALNKLQQNRSAVSAFENTALKNLDNFIATAKKVTDSGSPIVNKALRTVQSQGLGSEELAAYNAARTVALTEIARVVANPNLTGVLTDNARKEVESLTGPNATLKQILSAAELIKKDMANRASSLDSEIDATRDRIQATVRGKQQGAAPERTAVNPKTGEVLVLRNGQWVKK